MRVIIRKADYMTMNNVLVKGRKFSFVGKGLR